MGIKTESLANACNLSEGLSPDIYIKRTVTKQNNVFFIDGECPALTVKYHYYINKTPAQAFTPPTDEKKMGTIWIFVYYAVYGSRRGRNFLVLNWGGGSSFASMGFKSST